MKNITMTLAAIALATASFTTLAATEVQSAGWINHCLKKHLLHRLIVDQPVQTELQSLPE